jgi:hypothetical protein
MNIETDGILIPTAKKKGGYKNGYIPDLNLKKVQE